MSGVRSLRLRPPAAERFDHGFGRGSSRPGARASLKLRGVEGWRGVACLVVVGFHVWQNMDTDGDGLGPGRSGSALSAILSVDVAVDLFFVLSGLLLFLPFAHAALDDRRAVPAWREFLWRRCLRLLPVYWFLVLVCWATRNFGFATAEWKDLVLHLTLLQSFDSDTIFYTIGPAWTLSIEWIFYLSLAALGPAFVRSIRRSAPTQVRVVRMLGALTVVAAVSMLFKINVQVVWQIPVTDWAWRFGPMAKADDFALGMALAVVMVVLGNRRLPALATVGLAASGVALVYAARVRLDADPDSLLVILRHPVAAAGWCLLLLAVMTARSDRPARWVDNWLFVRLSIVAYTVYLVHEPVILVLVKAGLLSPDPDRYLLNLAVSVTLTLLAAWVLHRTVEEPWIDLGALQSRGGGRKNLYLHARPGPSLQAVTVEPGRPRLRDEVLAGSGHQGAAITVVASDRVGGRP
ncbi:acyltransferase family protein [Nocardioides rubriscoriae]|uniref:acyltransferase family protein n=1 Tax=Nocardioides rubriscoriae TaxID=642762 RepID=UPI001478F61B|nr:acyltransferase [Nocardioides rubriscoriae]